jgi:hypothetical protein
VRDDALVGCALLTVRTVDACPNRAFLIRLEIGEMRKKDPGHAALGQNPETQINTNSDLHMLRSHRFCRCNAMK